MLYSLQGINANDIPRLGYFFFTSAYLHVNHDDSTFTLWQANPTTNTNLVSVMSNDHANACSNGSTLTTPNGSTPTTSNSTATSSSQAANQTSLPGAAIGGIVAGGVVVVAAVGLMIFCLIRKRKPKQADLIPTDTKPREADPNLWHAKPELPPGPKADYNRQSGPAEVWGGLPQLGDNIGPPRELWAGGQDLRSTSRSYELG